jgi:hypothetical protein
MNDDLLRERPVRPHMNDDLLRERPVRPHMNDDLGLILEKEKKTALLLNREVGYI